MELQHLLDEELVSLYQQGNNKAFEVLLIRYNKRIFQYIYLYIRNMDITKDIFQDTFLKAIITIRQGKYIESGKFISWITRIAHNLIIDYYCREKRQNIISSDYTNNDLQYYAGLSEKSVEDILFNEQVLSDVVSLFNALPESQRVVVHMRFFEGMSFNDIALKTNVSVNTALGRMRYALINMRKIATQKDLYLQLI